jgi:hypothetical protein
MKRVSLLPDPSRTGNRKSVRAMETVKVFLWFIGLMSNPKLFDMKLADGKVERFLQALHIFLE